MCCKGSHYLPFLCYIKVKSFLLHRFGVNLHFTPSSSVLNGSKPFSPVSFFIGWFVWLEAVFVQLSILNLTVKPSIKMTKQCLLCLGVHVGKVDIGNCPMIAFDLHNCTTGIVCAVFCLGNIDFALYVLRNRINWFACFCSLVG